MPQVATDKSFNFYIPLDVTKASNGDWRIKGLASTEHLDLQGEVVRQNSLDITPLKEGRGLLNWDHKSGPENILGAIDKANLGDKGLEVEGYLFKESDKAKSIYNILNSLKDKDKRRLQMSIEGKVLRRAGMNGKEIAAARVDKVALTFDPVNPNTYAELIKSLTDEPVAGATEVVEAAAIDASAQESIVEQPKVDVQDSLGLEDVKELLGEAVAKAKSFAEDRWTKLKDQSSADSTDQDAGKLVAEDVKKLRKAIQETIEIFFKARDPLIILGQRVLQLWDQTGMIGNVYEQETLYYKFKFAVDSGDPLAVKELLPAVMVIWRDEGLGLDEAESKDLYSQACQLVDDIKKALATGNYDVAPANLAGGAALETESLASKPKKKKKAKKYVD